MFENIRNHFPFFKNNPKLVFLDTAASAQKPQSVIDSVTNCYSSEYANINRGVYKISSSLTEKYENVRLKTSKYINAENEDNVIFTKSATEAINLVASCFSEKYLDSGDEIILSYLEHHANIVPWQLAAKKKGFKIVTTNINNEGQLDYVIEDRVRPSQRDWVLVGGPPCQAYSHAGRGRNRAKDDYIPEEDKRHFLYEEYLRIIARHWPAVVIMENVQGILSSRIGGRKIFGNILRDLADPAGVFGDRRRTQSERYRYRLYPLAAEHGEPDLFGYSAKRPMDYVVNCEMFGVPQRRSRVILLTIRDDIAREPDNLELSPGSPATVKSVLAGLPRLRSGLTEEKDTDRAWMDVLRSALDEAWLDQIKPDRDSNVRDRILQTLDTLLMPRSGRGSEFVRKKKKHNKSKKNKDFLSFLYILSDFF